MSKAKPKLFVVNRGSNRISQRSLSTFEQRNPMMFELRHSVHNTWAEAHSVLVAARCAAVRKAEKELAGAKRALQKAMTMQQKGGDT